MNFKNEIETLIRARYPIIYVVTSEEMRVQNMMLPEIWTGSLDGEMKETIIPSIKEQ